MLYMLEENVFIFLSIEDIQFFLLNFEDAVKV